MSKNIVIVLGSGRSGTSLMMQVLHGFGMAVSENLIDASVANPEGPYEDAEIFKLHADLISELGASVTMPMPDDWLKEKPTFLAIDSLAALIQDRLENAIGIFGFKDPKTSMLIPVWVRVFNKLKIIPNYILVVRNPAATISSYLRQYNQSEEMAELVWLVRMIESLDNTAADCFIAHYEGWFNKPVALALAKELLAYTGLGQSFKGDVSEVLAKTVKTNLNRASKDDYEVKNPYVLKLYETLKTCSGADFDRDGLMTVVKECRQAMDGFKGWYQLAHQANRKLADTQARLEKANDEASKVKGLQAQIRELENERAKYALLAAQVQKLERQLDQMMALDAM